MFLRARNGRVTTKREPAGGPESIEPGARWEGLGGSAGLGLEGALAGFRHGVAWAEGEGAPSTPGILVRHLGSGVSKTLALSSWCWESGACLPLGTHHSTKH
jgi:hypothetical protein